MQLKNWALAIAFLAAPGLAKSVCTSGDCQQGAIAGPYTAAQVAEFSTTAPFPICVLSCIQGSWDGDQTEGIDAAQNIGTQYQFYDGSAVDIDDNVAVGPTISGGNGQILEWLNPNYLQAYDKGTGQPIFTSGVGGTMAVPVNVGKLWSSTTQPECEASLAGNVQVIFDRLDNVFVISRRVVYTSGGVHQSAWCVAASSNSDLSNPSTQWYAYEYKMSTAIPCVPSSNNCTTGAYYNYFPDWPRMGTWSNGFYLTFDLQDPTAAYVEAGFEACQLDRADIVKGKPSNPITCYSYLVPQSQRPSLIHSVDVADIDSPAGPAGGQPEYFLSIVNPSNAQQGYKGLQRCTSTSKTTPCTSNQLAMFTWGTKLVGPTFIAVNPYTPGCYNTSKPGAQGITFCVPEPSTNVNVLGGYGAPDCGNYIGSTPCLDSLGDRMANRLAYNNLSSSGGPNGEYLTASHVVMESTSNQRTGVRFYILKVSNGTASVVVNSSSTGTPSDLEDPNGILFSLMPSTALDLHGNLGMAFTTSGAFCSTCSTQNHPALNFVVLPWGASNFDASTVIVQGTADQENTPDFGEYAATVIDPSDNLTFYGVGEYYNTNQTGTTNCYLPTSDCHTWQTRIFRGQYGNPF